ncbi:MAG: response regulator, partial [Bacteroidota bacterium]
FLIDLSLRGDKDGIYLIKELRRTEKYANTPIVVVTANALKRDEETAINAGATTFIRKPVENERLTAEFVRFL